MPYIKDDFKLRFEKLLLEMFKEYPSDPGELNFLMTKLCQSYLAADGGEPCYRDYNDVIGALESCKLELYRRAVSIYEIKKANENGDVY